MCTFNASSSSDDSGVAWYDWSFGDAAAAFTTSNSVTTHQYPSKGSYTVKLTVRDGAGLSASVTHTINVKPGR